MEENNSNSMGIPRLFNVFDMPEIKSVRGVSSFRQEVNHDEIVGKVDSAKKVRTSGKEVVKFEEGKGKYLLLFPSGYVQISAPSEDEIREVLKSFRDSLFDTGLIT